MLKTRCIILLISLCSIIKAHAQTPDTVYMFNGQILIGEIKGSRLGELIIDDVDLHVLQIKMYKIKTIKAATKFRINTQNGQTIYGILRPSAKDGWVNIHLDNMEIIPTEILDLDIIALQKGFFKRLDGNLSAGFSYAKSSSLGQLNCSFDAVYLSKHLESQLSLSTISSIDSSTYSRDREDGSLMSAYNLTPAWSVWGGFIYQRNLELSLARRFQEQIGGGNKIILRRYCQLWALSGVSFNQEISTSGTTSGLLMEIPLTLRFNYFKYHAPNLQINSTQSVYYSLSQKNRIRYDTNTSFRWKLWHDFRLTITPYTSFDNQPPEGDSNFDFGVSISISYQF